MRTSGFLPGGTELTVISSAYLVLSALVVGPSGQRSPPVREAQLVPPPRMSLSPVEMCSLHDEQGAAGGLLLFFPLSLTVLLLL